MLFKWTLGYHVRRKSLPTNDSQVHFERVLADFVADNIRKQSLLIVYYTGHGSVDQVTGDLRLSA